MYKYMNNHNYELVIIAIILYQTIIPYECEGN